MVAKICEDGDEYATRWLRIMEYAGSHPRTTPGISSTIGDMLTRKEITDYFLTVKHHFASGVEPEYEESNAPWREWMADQELIGHYWGPQGIHDLEGEPTKVPANTTGNGESSSTHGASTDPGNFGASPTTSANTNTNHGGRGRGRGNHGNRGGGGPGNSQAPRSVNDRVKMFEAGLNQATSAGAEWTRQFNFNMAKEEADGEASRDLHNAQVASGTAPPIVQPAMKETYIKTDGQGNAIGVETIQHDRKVVGLERGDRPVPTKRYST